MFPSNAVVVSAAIAACIALSACAPPEPVDARASRPLRFCEDAVADAIGPGRGQARAVAVAAMRQQFAEVKGYLVGTGFRRVKAHPTQVSCKSYALATTVLTGWMQCTASTRFCVR